MLKAFIHQDNIVADLLDAIPGDVIFLAPQKAEKAALSIGYDGTNPSLRQNDFHIFRITNPAAVTDIDDFLAPQISHSALHKAPSCSKHIPYPEIFYANTGPSYAFSETPPFSDKMFPLPPGIRTSRMAILITHYSTQEARIMQSKVEICGVNTAKLKVLKNAETIALLKRTKEGDQQARQELIEGNLRLVLSVIQKFMGRGENADDLFQIGCIGLIKAIDNFDITQPVRFSTYGVPMIVGEIRRYLRDNSSIRVSRSMRDTAYRVLQVKEQIINRTQREPTIEEIAKELDLPKEEIVFALDAISAPVSLYEPIYSEGGDAICVIDQVSDTKNTDESWLEQIALKDAIQHLSERERYILALRFYEGKTQMEVSTEVGISQAQVSRLEKNAMKQIKKDL